MGEEKEFIILNEVDIAPLIRLKNELESSFSAIDTNIEKAGAIKFFEMAYELSWKILKRVLLVRDGKETKSGAKDIFREAAKAGYISDPELWFKFIETRNETVHAYDEGTANEVVGELPLFVSELSNLINTLKGLD